jgi:HK97 gp10 family phage protein
MAQYSALHFELGVRNLQALAANFHTFDTELQKDVRALVRETAQDTRDLTSVLAPKDTEFMADHVDWWLTNSELGFEVGWHVDDFVEAGLAFYPFFQEFGTRFMAAQPSLGPAWDANAPIFTERLTRLLRESVARLETR